MSHKFEFNPNFSEEVLQLLLRYGYDESFGDMLTPLALTAAILARSLLHKGLIDEVDADRLPEWFHKRLCAALQTVKNFEKKR